MITLTREEAQQVLDVLKDINKLSVGVNAIFLPAEIDEVMETLRAKLTKPEPEREQCDMPCIEDDGCPTEKAVLQRFWRKHRQLEPEPVAEVVLESMGVGDAQIVRVQMTKGIPAVGTKLYTAPPQREWQSLTDDDLHALHYELKVQCMGVTHPVGMYRVLEKALKEKNNG